MPLSAGKWAMRWFYNWFTSLICNIALIQPMSKNTDICKTVFLVTSVCSFSWLGFIGYLKNGIMYCSYSPTEAHGGRCGLSCCLVPFWYSTFPFWCLHIINPPKVLRQYHNHSRQNKSPGLFTCLNGFTLFWKSLLFPCLTSLFTHFIYPPHSACLCLCQKQDNNRQVLRGRITASVDAM